MSNLNINVEMHLAKNGEEILKINDYFIHSKYNPIKEAQQIVENQYVPHSAHIFFGYGSGHLINAFLQVRKFNEVIIVVDPLFDKALIERPLSNQQQNIYYLKADILEDFEQYLSYLAKDVRIAYKVVCSPNYDKIFAAEYKLLLTKVKDVQNRNLVNDFTLLKFAKTWYRNFLENLYHLETDYSAAVLQKKYTAPAIVVSGGPSLAKQLDLLKLYRTKVIVICAGSTINSLLAHNIEPDYVVTIDGGMPNFRHFQQLKLKNSKIVYTLQNHPQVRHSFEKPGYVVESKGHPTLTRYVKEELKVELPLFLGGASVAHTAFNFAMYITTGPIALIGQDLAYTNNLTHAPSNKHARKIDEAFIEKRQAFQIKGFDGGKIWTDPVFNSMRLEFEDLIKMEPPQNDFYNCTEGGAQIHGFAQMPFQLFCEQFTGNEDVEIIEYTQKNNHFSTVVCLERERKQYKKLLTILNEALLILKKNYSKNFFDSNSLKKLDKIDAQIQNLMNVLTVDLLISPVTMRIMNKYLPKENETSIEAFQRSYMQMQDLYQSMKENITEAIAIVSEILEKRESHE